MRKDMFLHSLAIYEANMAKLAAKVDNGRKERSKSLTFRYTGITKNNIGDAVVSFSVPSQSDPSKSYDCFMAVIPKGMSLFAVAHNQRKLNERITALKNADVKCFCTCPDFNWAGMKYNMKHKYSSYEDGHQSSEGVPDGSDIPPRVRDPKGKNTLCKHLMAVCKGILTNASSIMGDARKAKFPAAPKTTANNAPILNKNDAENTNNQPEVNILDKKVAAEPSAPNANDIKVLNGNTQNIDKPTEMEAINNLSNSEPVKTPEVNAVIDALTNTLTNQDSSNQDSAINSMNHDNDETDEQSPTDMPILNGGNKGITSSIDFDDSPNLPMFNPPDD